MIQFKNSCVNKIVQMSEQVCVPKSPELLNYITNFIPALQFIKKLTLRFELEESEEIYTSTEIFYKDSKWHCFENPSYNDADLLDFHNDADLLDYMKQFVTWKLVKVSLATPNNSLNI